MRERAQSGLDAVGEGERERWYGGEGELLDRIPKRVTEVERAAARQARPTSSALGPAARAPPQSLDKTLDRQRETNVNTTAHKSTPTPFRVFLIRQRRLYASSRVLIPRRLENIVSPKVGKAT